MIYLDYNATSPVHSEVRKGIAPFLEELFGNASSLHAPGRQARAAVETVRSQLLSALGDREGEIVFTSGGTEADNLALKGVLWAARDEGRDHLIISSVEHNAVLQPARRLAEEGFRVSVVPVDEQGVVDLEILEAAIESRTALISVLHANNETGTIQPIEEIARIARSRAVPFHTDAVQSFGKLPLDVRTTPVDLASVSSHKLGGLKGTGALYLRRGIRLHPILHGGPQERDIRGGTENVVGIVGLGAAVAAALRQREDGTLDRIQEMRNHLEAGLKERIPHVELNGHPRERLPGTLNVSFIGCEGQMLMMALDLAGICVSTGSACSSGSTEPSHVLAAMGCAPSRMEGSIRFSIGWGTTPQEIDQCLDLIPPIVERVRHSRAQVSR